MIGPSDDPPDEPEFPTHCVACGTELPEDGTEPTCGSLECATVYAARQRAEAEGEEAYALEVLAEQRDTGEPGEYLRALREGLSAEPTPEEDIRADLAYDASRERGRR